MMENENIMEQTLIHKLREWASKQPDKVDGFVEEVIYRLLFDTVTNKEKKLTL